MILLRSALVTRNIYNVHKKTKAQSSHVLSIHLHPSFYRTLGGDKPKSTNI